MGARLTPGSATSANGVIFIATSVAIRRLYGCHFAHLYFERTPATQRVRHQAELFSPLQKLARLGVIGIGRDGQRGSGDVADELSDTGNPLQSAIDVGL